MGIHNKYIELNYPYDQEILKQKDKYLKQGSITHTAHALRGFSFLNTKVNGIEPNKIRRWIESNANEIGFVVPELPANPDEVKGLAKEIRHTATSCLSLIRLKEHISNNEIITEIDKWIDAHAKLLLGFSQVWVHDPRMTYSYAYLLELFDLLRNEKRYKGQIQDLTNQIKKGLELLFALISTESPYWCANSHKETMIFYTLLILNRVLIINETYENSVWIDKIFTTLDEISRKSRNAGGVMMGESKIDKKFNSPDLGTSASFFEACKYFNSYIEKDEGLLELSAKLFFKCSEDVIGNSKNSITHSWESILALNNVINISENLNLKYIYDDVNEHISEIQNNWINLKRFPQKHLNKIDTILGVQGKINSIFKRDIWPSIMSLQSL